MTRESCFFLRFVLGAALSLIIAMTAAADDSPPAPIEQTYRFASPQVETVKIDDELFDRATIDGCPVSGVVGQPALPTKRARILLPYGHDFSGVEVITGEKLLVGTGLRLPPVEQPFAMSTPPDQIGPLAG